MFTPRLDAATLATRHYEAAETYLRTGDVEDAARASIAASKLCFLDAHRWGATEANWIAIVEKHRENAEAALDEAARVVNEAARHQ